MGDKPPAAAATGGQAPARPADTVSVSSTSASAATSGRQPGSKVLMDDLRFSEAFAQFLVDTNVIAPEDALQALDEQRRRTPPIGRLALKQGMLNMKQVFAILAEQPETGLRFGEQAIFMGYLERETMELLLEEQRRVRPGLGEILTEMGVVKKGVLQKSRREFVRGVETVLI
jgi:hypothetical protein